VHEKVINANERVDCHFVIIENSRRITEGAFFAKYWRLASEID